MYWYLKTDPSHIYSPHSHKWKIKFALFFYSHIPSRLPCAIFTSIFLGFYCGILSRSLVCPSVWHLRWANALPSTAGLLCSTFWCVFCCCLASCSASLWPDGRPWSVWVRRSPRSPSSSSWSTWCSPTVPHTCRRHCAAGTFSRSGCTLLNHSTS